VLARPRATVVAAQTNDLTERRRRCVHPAPNLQYPRGLSCVLGRPCVVGAVQVAPTPRIRPREVQRSGGGSEAHGAGKPRPSSLKLALVWSRTGMDLLCASKRSRQIRHLADGKRTSGCSHVTLSTGRPLPSCARRLASLQAACSLLTAFGMHASRRQPQACVCKRRRRWHVRALTSQSLRSDRGCSPRMASACSLQQFSRCILHVRAGKSVCDRGGTVESRVARLFKFAPPMCRVRSRTGQWACPATRAASCSEAVLIDRLLIVT